MLYILAALTAAAVPVAAVMGYKAANAQTETAQEQSKKSVNILALGAGAFLAYKFYKGR